jgi:hypothetical protein
MGTRYKPVKDQRYFNRRRKYSEIDWNNEAQVVRELKAKLEDWYINPAKALSGVEHSAFAVLALTCMLIDTLAQFEAGETQSKRSVFKAWLRHHFKNCDRKFRKPIMERAGSTTVEVSDYADAVYSAFRCGLLHESHAAIYSGIVGQQRAFRYHEKGLTMYGDNSPCPTIVIDPARLFKRVLLVFEEYFKKLLDTRPQHQHLRDNFKKKFLSSYGVDIGNEA